MARPTFRRAAALALFAAILLAAGGFAFAWRPAIAPIPVIAHGAFASAQIERGAELAAIGDCAVCHTVSGGPSFAGGRGIPTPFGTVYATNITPDPATGIGAWSEAAFSRAMRDGIDRAGRHLYPVLPYPHFTRATDDDIAALYAFLMTRAPVRQAAPANRLPFPMNFRPVLAVWDALYLRPGPWRPDPAHGAAWNRGAYLAEAVGHCGACHTPHNLLGAERSRDRLAGGEAEGWYAPALQAGSPAPVGWTVAALATYLRTGFDSEHGAAAGPMTAVTSELAAVPEDDIAAIATYIASLMPHPTATAAPPPAADASAHPAALALFDGACASCHGSAAPMTRNGAPSLSLGTAVNAPTPQGVVEIILHGIPWREGRAAPFMPAFADALTDDQVAALAAYLRANYSTQPPWKDVAGAVAAARQDGGA